MIYYTRRIFLFAVWLYSAVAFTMTAVQQKKLSLPADAMEDLDNYGVARIDNFIPDKLVSRLLEDTEELAEADLFNGLGTGPGSASRMDLDTRVTEGCWLYPPPPADVGNSDACNELMGRLSTLQKDISVNSDKSLLPFESEAQYLRYPEGGFYKRHVDVPNRDVRTGREQLVSTRRCVSVLAYLTEKDWDQGADGGALRVYGPAATRMHALYPAFPYGIGREGMDGEREGGEAWIDVAPSRGSLMILDSETVPHAVLETRRPRTCIVGWYHRYVEESDGPGRWKPNQS